MQYSAGELRMDLWVTFFYWPLHMDMLVLADQKEHLHQLFVDTGCNLEDLPQMMDARDGWRKSQGNPYYQDDLIMMKSDNHLMIITSFCLFVCLQLYYELEYNLILNEFFYISKIYHSKIFLSEIYSDLENKAISNPVYNLIIISVFTLIIIIFQER